MKPRSIAPMRIAKIGYLVISSVFCVVGILMLVFPEASVKFIGKFFGIAMTLFGIIKLIGYFSKDLYRLAFQYDLQFGILLLILGLIVLIKPKDGLNFIGISLGISVLTDGLFKIQIALDAKKFGIRKWWMITVLALLACAFGLILVFRPSESVKTIVRLIGISLFSEGILNFCLALSTVKIVKNQVPDLFEGETDAD